MGWLLWSRKNIYSIQSWKIAVFIIVFPIVGFCGAKLLYILENYENVMSGGDIGMSFFGTVFIVPLVMPFIGWLMHIPARKTLDICVPGGIAVLGCIRINCFIMGCCGGKLVYWFNTWFPLPAQLFEAIGDFLILSNILRWERNSNPNGRIYPVFLMAYGLLRFALEWIRVTDRPWLGMAHGHWFSIIAMLISISTLIYMKRGECGDDIKEIEAKKLAS